MDQDRAGQDTDQDQAGQDTDQDQAGQDTDQDLAGQDTGQDLAGQDTDQDLRTGIRRNLLLLQMNMLRVLLTKTVSLSTIVTIRALLR